MQLCRMVRHRASSEEAARILSTDLAKAAALHVRLAKIASDAEAARREAELESPKATLAASTAKQQADLEAIRVAVTKIRSANWRSWLVPSAGGGPSVRCHTPTRGKPEYHVLNCTGADPRLCASMNTGSSMLRKTGLRKIDAHRLHGVITGTHICKPTKAFIGIYGEGRRCLTIAIQLEKT
jgi:hypothetical protein